MAKKLCSPEHAEVIIAFINQLDQNKNIKLSGQNLPDNIADEK